MPDSEIIAAGARALCIVDGYDPDYLEPGDLPHTDGINSKGEPCHFLWRQYADKAQAVLRAALETAGVTPEQVEFALGDALRPFYANKMNPEETALFKAIRAAYPASQSEGE